MENMKHLWQNFGLQLIAGGGIVAFFLIGSGGLTAIPAELVFNLAGAFVGSILAIMGAVWIEDRKRNETASTDTQRLRGAVIQARRACEAIVRAGINADPLALRQEITAFKEAIDVIDFLTEHAAIHNVDAWIAAVRLKTAWDHAVPKNEIRKFYFVYRGWNVGFDQGHRNFFNFAEDVLPIAVQAEHVLDLARH